MGSLEQLQDGPLSMLWHAERWQVVKISRQGCEWVLLALAWSYLGVSPLYKCAYVVCGAMESSRVPFIRIWTPSSRMQVWLVQMKGKDDTGWFPRLRGRMATEAQDDQQHPLAVSGKRKFSVAPVSGYPACMPHSALLAAWLTRADPGPQWLSRHHHTCSHTEP